MAEVWLKVYTREPDSDGYSIDLANSVHMAYSVDGKDYVPFYNNYGILFAKGSITGKNTIHCKGLKNPCVFQTAGGSYVIMAPLCDNAAGYDSETAGSVALWVTEDFIRYGEMRMLYLNTPACIDKISGSYNAALARYELLWQDREGNVFENYVSDLESAADMTAPVLRTEREIASCNVVAVPEELVSRLKRKLLPPERCQMADSAIKLCFPLATGWADPQIFRWKDKYYFIATNDNNNDIGIYVRESDTVEGLFEGAEPVLLLDVDRERKFIQNFWAPELHKIGDDIYILFAVSGESFGPQCHMMKLKRGGEIATPSDWEVPERVRRADGSFLAEHGITLDMTYFEAGGRSYLVWSYREHIFSERDTGSMLYIATTDKANPYRLTSEPVLLSRPLWGWENTEGTINNEGPFALLRNGKVYLAFSGGSAGGDSYAVGLLVAEETKDLLNPLCWEKRPAPMHTSYTVKGEYGPGHNSFFTDENGNVYTVYHAKTALKDAPRCTAVRGVWFDEDGEPVVDIF